MFVHESYIPLGDAGTVATVEVMARMIRRYATHPVVRRTAQGIVAGVGGRDYVGQARTLRVWLMTHFRFLRDPLGAELLHTPDLLLRDYAKRGVVQGDCDDAAVLAGALARSVGLRVRLVVVGFRTDGPFEHVWAEVAPLAGHQWIEMDVTRSRRDLPEYIKRTRHFIV